MRFSRVLHALAVAGCVVAVARPDRLWGPVAPGADREDVGETLALLAEPSTPAIDETLADQIEERICALQGYRRKMGEVARGDSLDQILRSSGVTAAEAHGFTQALKPVFDPRRARPGDTYELLIDDAGRLARFLYRRGSLEVYQAKARGDEAAPGWDVERVALPVEHREVEIAGRITDSLYASFLDAGGDADLVMAFVDLFGWDIDFTRESREGDEFRVIFDRLFVEGEAVGNGRIYAARYDGAVGGHTAVYYKSTSADGYFDPAGRSVRKSFLRSPLKFTRISSAFSRARRHPILDVVRPHSGVDYAAPAGTPVRSVADGTVLESGWRGGAGKAVTIRHARGYETSYYHLSRFGSGIRAGSRVKQGQVIGFVGETGLATGPHLCFRVKKDGKWVDPQKEKYVAGDPIPASEREPYRRWLENWVRRLESVECPVQVAQKETR